MKYKFLLMIFAAIIAPLHTFAFSLRTVYQDAEASDPSALLWSLISVAIAFPVIFFALHYRMQRPPDMSSREFSRRCVSLALQQLAPFLGLFYLAGGVIFMVLIVAVAIGFSAWHVITSGAAPVTVVELTEYSFNYIWVSVMSFFSIWWFVSLVLSIRWLPKSLDE